MRLDRASTCRASTRTSWRRFRWSATPAPALEQLAAALTGYRVDASHAELAARRNREWDAEVERLTAPAAGPPTQAQVIGVVNAGRG